MNHRYSYMVLLDCVSVTHCFNAYPFTSAQSLPPMSLVPPYPLCGRHFSRTFCAEGSVLWLVLICGVASSHGSQILDKVTEGADELARSLTWPDPFRPRTQDSLVSWVLLRGDGGLASRLAELRVTWLAVEGNFRALGLSLERKLFFQRALSSLPGTHRLQCQCTAFRTVLGRLHGP